MIDEREAQHIPPTIEQMQARDQRAAAKTRFQTFTHGTRSVMRLVQIVSLSFALLAGLGCTGAAIILLLTDPSSRTQRNTWFLLVFGIFITSVSLLMFRRFARKRAPLPTNYL